jgi:prepilin peptidase CpaA
MFNQYGLLITVSLLTFVTAIAVTDLRRHRIPNLLTAPAALVGLSLNFATSGVPGVLASGAGLLVGLVVFLPFYLLRGFSAGDVKAMAAVGAFLDPKGALLAAGWILVAGAIGGAWVLIMKAGYPALLTLLRRWLLRLFAVSVPDGGPDLQPSNEVAASLRFPYGLAIACGTLASISWS